MYICDYCGRNFKNHYDSCPGCGSTSLHTASYVGEVVIKTPPKGGYHINNDNLLKAKSFGGIFKWVGLGLSIFIVLSFIPFLFAGLFTMKEEFEFGLSFIILPLCVSLIFVIVGVGFFIGGLKYQKKVNKEMERIQKLSTMGTLIKNIPYDLVPSNIQVNGRDVYCLKIVYKNSNGVEIPLVSDPKYNAVLGDKDGTCDLLIDPNDYSNYYIDLEII